MSLIGCSCLILSTAGQWKMAHIRAASQPLLTNSDLTQMRVLVEWCERLGGGGLVEAAQREWVDMTNPEVFKSVYVEKSLLWARRVLSSEQNRAVAWPARAFTFLCGIPFLLPDMLVVEYFCDKEKTELHIHETKELQLLEAKATLSQQPHMLQELNEWEKINRGRELLQTSTTILTGCRISVCNVQQPLSWINGTITAHNLQTKELTVLEDHTQSIHTVNPLMVHVLIHGIPEDVVQQDPQAGSWKNPPPLSLVNSPQDILPSTNSPAPAINSPRLTSPVIQETLSPHFNMNPTTTNSKSPLSLYRSPSQDILPTDHFNTTAASRRSSLQQMNISLMRSEPNLHRRCSLDPVTLQRLSDPFDFFHDLPHSHNHSHSLGKIPFNSMSSPTSGGGGGNGAVLLHVHSSPHGSNSQLSAHGSNSQLSAHGSNSQLSAHGSNSMLSRHGSNSKLSFHGSNPQLSNHGSNSSLSDGGGSGGGGGGGGGGLGQSSFPNFPTPEDIIKHTDRSKSLGNIFSCVQTQPLGQHHQQHHYNHHHHQRPPQQPLEHNQSSLDIVSGGAGRRISSSSSCSTSTHTPASSSLSNSTGGRVGSTAAQNSQKRMNVLNYGAGLGRIPMKKHRFDVLPTISGEDLATAVSKTLCRSASQPAVFPPKLLEKRLHQLTGGAGVFSSGEGTQRHEDDLDIIKQIIETDISMHSEDPEDSGGHHVNSLRSQSLTHIPGQFSSACSLPSLHHAESMHVLHTNYNSAPNFSHFDRMCMGGGGGGYNGSLLHPDPGKRERFETGRPPPPPGMLVQDYPRTILGDRKPDVNNFPIYSGGQEERTGMMQGANQKGFDSQNLSRMNSLYDAQGQSAAGTPVSVNNSAQNTPISDGGLFDFSRSLTSCETGYREGSSNTSIADNRNLSLNAGGYDGNSLDRFVGGGMGSTNSNITDPSRRNRFSSSSGGMVPDSSKASIMGGVGSGHAPGPTHGEGISANINMLSDYFTGGKGDSQGELGRSLEGAMNGGGGGRGVSSKTNGCFDIGTVPDNLNDESSLPVVATEAVLLVSSGSGGNQENDPCSDDLGEFSISRVINRQFSVGAGMENEKFLYDINEVEESDVVSPDPTTTTSTSSTSSTTTGPSPSPSSRTSKSNKPKKQKKTPAVNESGRSRGRPRLTEEEKQRRKELRELGLMKRSKRRTKEQVAQWRADKIMSPAKRGRKPGSGKKNIIKTSTGKVVFVSVNLSQYVSGTILLQNGFCRAYPGVSKCLDCGTCEGDLPNSKYCRFLEFRKLCIEDNIEPRVSVHGFADYTDVVAQDLVPWTPLKTNFSGMDESTALFILRRVIPNFISIVTEEAKTLPEHDVLPIWKRAVSGVRELCDTCDTSLFNFHWVCQSCGFCICPSCYSLAYNSEDEVEAVSSMQAAAWPNCVSSNQPHRPSGLILAQIIPANVLADVLVQALSTCNTHKIQVSIPNVLQRLMSVLNLEVTPQAKFQNESSKKSKPQVSTPTHSQLSHQPPFNHDDPPPPPPSSLHPPGFLGSHSTPSASLSLLPSYLPSSLSGGDISSIELPHSCSNGNEEVPEPAPMSCPHQWLCDGTLLCLLDARHSENITAFQDRWKRGEPVLVTRINQFLDKNLWTPQAFERDFGNELADLVDCRLGLNLLQLPSKTFWAGFEDMSARIRDPTKNEPRLLKLKDWPPGDDFSEKLPRRYNDLMNALPLQEYTRRDGRYNMASSLPSFFVKPDLGPKMYNAYGSPLYPHCGTTNLHLDISSAVNVMVYCNVPPSVADQEWKLIEDIVCTECCQETSRRIKDSNAKVGAIWHIYSASDADKIRALLREVYEETGLRPQTGSDPIHDQLVYLDSDLRQRLYHEYGVKGWAIAQCVGDAIFIPAGAPHQVRNLCSCIKIAEDFVSPEHVYECLKLTEEFRQLSERHSNREDKLQVKNIIYHSMKDIVGALKPPVK